MTTAKPIQRSATLSRQIKAELLQDLSSGIFGPGDRLPGEHALAERFGTTRNTVRRALSELEAAGMLRIVHGGGCFVRDEPVDYGIGDRTRFTQNLLSQNRYSSRRVLSARTEPAIATVAGHLHQETGAPVIEQQKVDVDRDGRPIAVGISVCAAARVRFVVRRGNRVDGDGDWSRRPAAARDEPYPSSPGIR